MLSRELLDVRLIRRPTASAKQPSIAVKLLKPKKCVWLNGRPMDIAENETREVQAGDTLALYQNQFEYELHLDPYRPDVVDLLDSSDDEGDGDDRGAEAARVQVHVDVEGREESTLASAAAENTAGAGDDENAAEADDRASLAKNFVTDSFICTICYGILTRTQILAPCGHNVCKDCAKDAGMFAYLESKQKKNNKKKAGRNSGNVTAGTASNVSFCPECRQEIDSIVPGKIMDNLIWNGMLSGTMDFDVEDIIEHLRKSGAKPTEMEARNIFRQHSTHLAEYLETIQEGNESAQADASGRSAEEGEAPPNKRARPENKRNNDDDDAISSY